MYPFRRLSDYLTRLSRYDQVLTGVLPYLGSDVKDMITKIRAGKRPFRPINQSQNRWLQDPVWDVIRTGWHAHPNKRGEISAMYSIFSSPGQQEVPVVKPSDSNTRNEKNLTRAGSVRAPKRKLVKKPPRTALPPQPQPNPETEIQTQINEMDQVGFSMSPLSEVNTSCSVLRTAPRRTTSG